MFARLVVLFITVPLIELFLLFRLYDLTQNALPVDLEDRGLVATAVTIGIILLTGFLGAWLAKQQGLGTIQRIQKSIAEGKLPGSELVDGGMILFAAALLVTPGILTDAFGFSLLMPPCRKYYRSLLKKFFPTTIVQFGHQGQKPNPFGQGPVGQDPFDNEADDGNVVDGTARPVTDDNLRIGE